MSYSAVKCRRVGMADEADSKSVVGNHVWVQVPSPAVEIAENQYRKGFQRFLYVMKEEKKWKEKN